MVYIINAQDCYDSEDNLAGVRNQLFTAITRSKAWVRVLGVGPRMDNVIQEFRRIKEAEFRLVFRYPDAQQKQRLKTVNRDMSVGKRRKIRENKSNVRKLLDDLESGHMRPEDLGKEELKRLRQLLDIAQTNV